MSTEDVQVIQTDIKTLIDRVASLKSINDMQLVEMRVIRDDLKSFQCRCRAQHKEVNDELADLQAEAIKGRERHAWTWKILVGMLTLISTCAFIYEVFIR